MVVIGRSVFAVDGDIEFVRSVDQVETLNRARHLGIARKLAGNGSLDMRVGAVAADTLGVEDPDAEDKIAHWLVGMDAEADLQRLARLEDVGRLTIRACQVDTGDLDLARSPASFDGAEHIGSLCFRD